MQKQVALVWNGGQVVDAGIGAGTTVQDLRKQFNLPAELLISRRDGLPFAEGEDIYGQVRDGEKLFASPPAVVGGHQRVVRGRAS